MRMDNIKKRKEKKKKNSACIDESGRKDIAHTHIQTMTYLFSHGPLA